MLNIFDNKTVAVAHFLLDFPHAPRRYVAGDFSWCTIYYPHGNEVAKNTLRFKAFKWLSVCRVRTVISRESDRSITKKCCKFEMINTGGRIALKKRMFRLFVADKYLFMNYVRRWIFAQTISICMVSFILSTVIKRFERERGIFGGS